MIEDAKGNKRAADTRKHRAPASPDGKVLASMATDGNAADAATFGKLCAKTSGGNGPALGDGAYCSSVNCEEAVARAGTRTLSLYNRRQ